MASIADPRFVPLREQLDQIIFDNADDEGLLRQPSLIAALASRHPHSIRLLTLIQPGPRNERFTCHAYALGLHASDDARRHQTRLVFPNRDFMRRLIDTILIEQEETACRAGDLVIYSSPVGIEHSGRWRGGRIQSKWGFAHIWEHAPHEVPLGYGDVVRYYRTLPHEEAVAAYVAFAREVDPSLAPR